MADLNSKLSELLSNRYAANLARVRELAASLSEKQFWTKPYPYGNSFGHLVLHLSGNLNYYLGARIADTGYVRHREREFTDSNPPSKEDALRQLDTAVGMAMETIRAQSLASWTNTYSAVGTDCGSRLDIILQCAAHMQHHIGQMIYLAYEMKRQQDNR
jgi:hypothetical protein